MCLLNAGKHFIEGSGIAREKNQNIVCWKVAVTSSSFRWWILVHIAWCDGTFLKTRVCICECVCVLCLCVRECSAPDSQRSWSWLWDTHSGSQESNSGPLEEYTILTMETSYSFHLKHCLIAPGIFQDSLAWWEPGACLCCKWFSLCLNLCVRRFHFPFFDEWKWRGGKVHQDINLPKVKAIHLSGGVWCKGLA